MRAGNAAEAGLRVVAEVVYLPERRDLTDEETVGGYMCPHYLTFEPEVPISLWLERASERPASVRTTRRVNLSEETLPATGQD